MSCDMWFGTKDYAQFIRTPQTGADVSPQAWGESGTYLNGGGYAMTSRNSHKEYIFSWGASASRESAQLMKSFYDGTFGRGKLYFVDPLTYTTNILPARWADPSITVDHEGPQLIPGVDPYPVRNPDFQQNMLPVQSAVFDLSESSPLAETEFIIEETNRVPNPRGVNATGILSSPGTGGVVGTYYGVYLTGFPVKEGVRQVWTEPTSSVGGGLAFSNVVVSAGQTIFPSVYASVNNSQSLQLEARFYQGATFLSTQTSTSVALTPDTPTRISLGATSVPSGANRVQLWVVAGGGSARAWDIGDRLEISAGSTAQGEYFDGDLSLPGKVSRWSGAVGNSPSESGRLELTSELLLPEGGYLFVPIPDGMQLNLGAFYETTTPDSGVYVVKVLQGGFPSGEVTKLTPVPANSSSILPDVISKTTGVIGVYLFMGVMGGEGGLLSVSGIHARLSVAGQAPGGETRWIGGQGNQGVRFVQPPTYINHTGVNGGQIEFAATLKETEE